MLLLLPLLLACDPGTTPGAGAGASGQDTAALPSPWELDGGPSEDDAIDAADAETSINDLLARLRTLHGWRVLGAYDVARANGDERCPYEEPYDTETYGETLYWYEVCYTRDGVGFNGPMTDWRFEEIQVVPGMDFVYQRPLIAPDGFAWTGRGLQGQTDIYSPAGAPEEAAFHFNCSCTTVAASGVAEDGSVAWLSYIDGARDWTEEDFEVLDPDLGVDLSMWAVDAPDGTRTVHASGGLSAFADGVGTARLTMQATRGADGGCTASAALLELTVRDSRTGHWAVVDYSGLSEDPACDAVCGTLETGGEVCLDLTPLVDWEGAPW